MIDTNTIICIALLVGGGVLMLWGLIKLKVILEQIRGESKEPLYVVNIPGKRMRKLKEL